MTYIFLIFFFINILIAIIYADLGYVWPAVLFSFLSGYFLSLAINKEVTIP